MVNKMFVKVWEYFLYAIRPEKRPTRVTFSPSTLHRELIKEKCKLTPSNNPFFNFLGEMRLKMAADEETYGSLNLHNCSTLSKTAGRLWKQMSDEEKAPYRVIATQNRKLKRLNAPPRKIEKKTKRKRCIKVGNAQTSNIMYDNITKPKSSKKKNQCYDLEKCNSNFSLCSDDIVLSPPNIDPILSSPLTQKVLQAATRGIKNY